MPKTKISEYSATNSSNTDIEGINIDEGCAPSGINNAIRELMVHLKEFQTGASGDAFTFAGGTLMSGTNTISGAAIISGNINSSGTNTFSGSNVMSFSGGSSASPSIYFASDTNTGIFSPAADTIAFTEGGAESMRIDSSGNLLVGITSARANAGDVQVSKGISFPATQSAQSDANTLDDYEEGTFTPTVSAVAVTYAANGQVGKYTKIGNVVYIYIYVQIATITTSGDNNLINGLPFTSANVTNLYPKLATMWNGFDFGGTVGVCQVTPNSTSISAGGCTNNGAFVDSFATGFSAGDWISVTGHYYV